MKGIKIAIIGLIILIVVNFLSACALVLVAGLGGTTGYLAAKQGYGVQSPVTKKH